MRSLVVKVGQVRNQILQQGCETSRGTSKFQYVSIIPGQRSERGNERNVPNPSRHRCVAAAEFQLACCLGCEGLPLWCSEQLFSALPLRSLTWLNVEQAGEAILSIDVHGLK